jgi:hypothetical protein
MTSLPDLTDVEEVTCGLEFFLVTVSAVAPDMANPMTIKRVGQMN